MAKIKDNIQCLQNESILKYLERSKSENPIFASAKSVQDPYYNCGCHPDIVERIWEGIGSALPADSKGLVYGTPVLVHPKSSVIFAIGLGTQYGLLLPGELATIAVTAGAKIQNKWSTGETMHIQLELGKEWVFGAWLAREVEWCIQVYELFDQSRGNL